MVIAAQFRDGTTSRADVARGSRVMFAGVTAVLFAASTAMTARSCSAMAGMGEMSMPGGWTMSMAWMRMPGQTWLGAAASFTGMWVVMMIAMMLPSLAPALWRYREAVAKTGCGHPDCLAALAGMTYFLVWTVIGAAIFPIGASVAVLEMQQSALARCVPMASGLVVLLAGVAQFCAWKEHHLACCRDAAGGELRADAAAARRFGLRLGLHCASGSSGLTAILLVLGVMDLRVMAGIVAAITAERLAPSGVRMARVIGAVAIGAGFYLVLRAAGLA